MLHEIDLRGLAERHGHDRAFVSFYFDGEAGRNGLDQRERRIHDLLTGQADELLQFEENMKLVRQWIEREGNGSEPCCVFASWTAEWTQGYKPGVELPNLLWVGPAPYIRPLAELQEEYQKFVVVIADNAVTRIWTVLSAQAETEKRIRGDVKNRVKKGGWSQQRYARRRSKELQHYAKEVAEVLDRVVREEGFERIVLLGSRETLGEIEHELTQAAAECVVGKKGVDVHEGEDELLEEAFELFFEEERQEEQGLWQQIQGEFMGNGLAAVGPDDVLRAALVGRVDTAIVMRDARLRATSCRDCENVFAGENERCKACGSASVFPVDFVDCLSRQLELTGADLDFVDPIGGLEKVGQVAALLRY